MMQHNAHHAFYIMLTMHSRVLVMYDFNFTFKWVLEGLKYQTHCFNF